MKRPFANTVPLVASLCALAALCGTTRQSLGDDEMSRPSPARLADPGSEKKLPAEEYRLGSAAFRAYLQRRGLTQLLDLHMKDFPPSSEAAGLIIARDMKLAAFADVDRPRAERLAAITEANRIRGQLIATQLDDPRRFQWRFELAHSLLYDETEPLLTSALYRDVAPSEPVQARAVADRARETVDGLVELLRAEYTALDRMPTQQFEKLERTGVVDELDRWSPRAEYLRLWAYFYSALARPESDPQRAAFLNEILARMHDDPTMLETPHERSRVQAQCFLLAGTVHRLLNNLPAAREHLDRAIAIAERVTEPQERGRVRWALRLALVQRALADRDDARFEQAVSVIARFRLTAGDAELDQGVHLAAAWLEYSVRRAWARSFESQGKAGEAASQRELAKQPIVALIKSRPARAAQTLYALYETIPKNVAIVSLDPLEKAALVIGLVTDGQTAPARSAALFDRAIEIGEVLLDSGDSLSAAVVPHVQRSVAIALENRGQNLRAARHLLRTVGATGDGQVSFDAARKAVELCAELVAEAPSGSDPAASELYLEALEVLLKGYPDSEAAKFWRFFYARTLDEAGRYADAAKQYTLVEPAHVYHLESLYLRLRALALDLQRNESVASQNSDSIRAAAAQIAALHREFADVARSRTASSEAAVQTQISEMLARSDVLTAEVHALPPIANYELAVELLEDFEGRHPAHRPLVGRVWRVRLLAFERSGKLDEANRAIPRFVEADPRAAGETLQAVYDAVAADADEHRESHDIEGAARSAQTALLLAEQIDAWSRRPDVALDDAARRLVLLQLAEAHLRTGNAARARELFAGLAPAATARPTHAVDVRAIFGLAQSLAAVGDRESALTYFNRLAVGLDPADPIRWKALVGDLQCRTALGQAPQDILKVIDQQRFLHPDLGGPEIKTQLVAIQRENENRRDGG